MLEDLGFFVIDNLPPALIGKVAELARGGASPQRYGFGRRRALRRRSSRISTTRSPSSGRIGARTRVLFLEASDDALVRRFDASRRRAPARGRRTAARRHPEGTRAARGAQGSRRRRARHVDAQRARAARPARRASSAADPRRSHCRSSIVSFGFKHGLPLDVDLVFDCRFLPEPALGRRAPPARRSRRAGARLRAGPADDARRSSTSCDGCSSSPSRRTSAKGRRTSRSRSGAPAAGTAASRWPRRSAGSSPTSGTGPTVRHRDVDRV